MHEFCCQMFFRTLVIDICIVSCVHPLRQETTQNGAKVSFDAPQSYIHSKITYVTSIADQGKSLHVMSYDFLYRQNTGTLIRGYLPGVWLAAMNHLKKLKFNLLMLMM